MILEVCEGKDAWFNLRYWTVSYVGCCEKPRKMPASIAGVFAEIRTGHLQTKPEALRLGDGSEAPIGRFSCRYGACLLHAVLCIPSPMLDVRPLYCLTWPGLVPFHCPLILLVSLVGISQFPFQLLRILENVVSVGGRDGLFVDSCGCAGKLHTNTWRASDATRNFDKQIIIIPTYCTAYVIYKLLQHVSANICSHLQGLHTEIVFS